jgi:hypothetical protein
MDEPSQASFRVADVCNEVVLSDSSCYASPSPYGKVGTRNDGHGCRKEQMRERESDDGGETVAYIRSSSWIRLWSSTSKPVDNSGGVSGGVSALPLRPLFFPSCNFALARL